MCTTAGGRTTKRACKAKGKANRSSVTCADESSTAPFGGGERAGGGSALTEGGSERTLGLLRNAPRGVLCRRDAQRESRGREGGTRAGTGRGGQGPRVVLKQHRRPCAPSGTVARACAGGQSGKEPRAGEGIQEYRYSMPKMRSSTTKGRPQQLSY